MGSIAINQTEISPVFVSTKAVVLGLDGSIREIEVKDPDKLWQKDLESSELDVSRISVRAVTLKLNALYSFVEGQNNSNVKSVLAIRIEKPNIDSVSVDNEHEGALTSVTYWIGAKQKKRRSDLPDQTYHTLDSSLYPNAIGNDGKEVQFLIQASDDRFYAASESCAVVRTTSLEKSSVIGYRHGRPLTGPASSDISEDMS